MSSDRVAVPLLRVAHFLSVSAWVGGGIGVLLLLILDYRAETAVELQTFNRVIDAVDDWIIAPGALATLASGLLLALTRRLPLTSTGFFGLKLYCTLGAIAYGLLFVAPRLERLLDYSRRDNLAVFDDRLYSASYLTGVVGCLVQAFVVLGLLAASVCRPRIGRKRPVL